jgi:hypothetical protein
MEIALWLFLILPGLIYSVWRLTSREKVCGICGGRMIPINSPRGQQLWCAYHESEVPAPRE